MSKYSSFIYLFLALISVFIIAQLFPELRNITSTSKDGFSADRVPSGEYPHEVNEPLLYPVYPKKKTDYGIIFPGNDSTNNSKLYPVSANISSFDQNTNNVRDWITPDNGSCSPSAMCGALYEAKEPENYKMPDPLPFNIPEKRVGFYASTRL